MTDLCEKCGKSPVAPGNENEMCEDCQQNAEEAAYERYIDDGETFRGGEAAAYESEQMLKYQREK